MRRVTRYIKQRLIDLGLSQKELAEGIGKHPAFLNNRINGKNPISITLAIDIAEGLGCRPIDILNKQSQDLIDDCLEKRRQK